MDLDFSFSLVSSLTPRSQHKGSSLAENSKLSSKSRKIKKNSASSQSHCTKTTSYKHNKENDPLAEPLISDNDFSSIVDASGFAVDMANIAIRSNKNYRDTRKTTSALLSTTNTKISYKLERDNESDSNIKKASNQKKNNKLYDEKEVLSDSHNVTKSNTNSVIKKVNDIPQNDWDKVSDISDSLINLVDNCLNINSSPTTVESHSRGSELIESSFSTAYDSGSFKTIRRRGVKVITETPDSEESHKLLNSSSSEEKSLFGSIKSNRCMEKDRSVTSREDLFLSCKSNLFPEDTPLIEESTKSYNIDNHNEILKQNTHTLTDTARIQSSLKSNLKVDNKHNRSNNVVSGNVEVKQDKKKSFISSEVQEIISAVVNDKTVDATSSKQLRNNKPIQNNSIKCEIKSGKTINGRDNDKYSIKTQKKTNTEEFNSFPLSEEIPKFDQINNWLKETQENSIILVSSDSSFNTPEKIPKKSKQKSKRLKSISPRIKKKIQEAQATLKEEQQLFEELYGTEFAKRLSEEAEGSLNNDCNDETLEISEQVLDKIYGTVWQRDEVLPNSEPRKGRPKNPSKKMAPQTERKKYRTSIYDPFSSSSSEDRFEEFLENVHRGKLKSKRTLHNPCDAPDFINDSDSDCDTSFTYYQSIISSTVKEDIEKLQYPRRGRRLSFGSREEDCSETGRSNLKHNEKQNKTDKSKNKPELKFKKGAKIDVEAEKNCDNNGITPIKVEDKKSDKHRIDVKTKYLIENNLPNSIGKSQTPKNKVNRDNSTNTEERLKEKYLFNAGDFKVPKSINSFKTPNKSLKQNIPSSPALSFLSSLSEITAGLPCHPDAVVYKKNFKDKKEELSTKLFFLFNKEVFDNQLPANMSVEWSTRMTSTSGFCYNKRTYSNNQVFRSSRIVLSSKIVDRSDRLRDTLVHEMCHAATWIINGASDGHGPKWKAWADRANRRFPELPKIKRCHDYAVSTKFTYKCVVCGYSIGRHTKSLNTDRKRCGFCYGKFEVFLTAKLSTAGATSGSDSVKSTRNPTGFALFVKENYAAVKKENNVPHGQVMKLLSQKFADMKVSKQNAKET